MHNAAPRAVWSLHHPMELSSSAPLRAIVAIPVRNEAERIGACLDALAAQVGTEGFGQGFGQGFGHEFGVVLLLNNCTDGTEAAVARTVFPAPLRTVVRRFDGASAGWARREAMEEAAIWLEEAGQVPANAALLTTDADSRVPPDWIARNLAALARGADAVAGRITLDAHDAARLPDALHARGRLEATYETLLTEIEARLDPVPHDPWPRHRTASGASLAVRLSTYRAVGGLPSLALGEDRAFVDRLVAHGFQVRHDPAIAIVTSGRLEGRAPGGAADTMRLRCAVPESPCDDALEALPRALARIAWRRRLRRLHRDGRLGRTALWAPWLGIRRDDARALARLATADEVVAAATALSPRLAPRPLRPRALPLHIALARGLLAPLRRAERPAPPRVLDPEPPVPVLGGTAAE